MDKMDEALDAEWLSPDDLIEIHEEEPRVSDIRALRAPRREIVEIREAPTPRENPSARDAREALPMKAPARARRAASPMQTAAALARLTLFFVIGLGLGSIFALGVATVLEIKKDSAHGAQPHTEVRAPALDSAAAMPDLGEPGPAL